MRIAVVVKQVPTFTEMALDDDGRLIRAGLPLELNPYCRRAVSQAVDLAAAGPPAGEPAPDPPPPIGPAGSEAQPVAPRAPIGPATQPVALRPDGSAAADVSVTVVTLGPPSAEDVLREAVAWGLDRGVDIDGLLVSDPAFAGSDTLATARALAAALRLTGPFDLILAGRNSVDSETGQVPPELAELLDIPYLTGVRSLRLEGRTVHASCEHDDGSVEAEVDLPAMLSCAERLIEPCKVDPAGRAAVPDDRLGRLTANNLGPGPWGQEGSPTRVGAVRVHEVAREGLILEGPFEDQIRRAVDVLVRRGALPARDDGIEAAGGDLPDRDDDPDRTPRGALPARDDDPIRASRGALPRPGNRAGPPVAVVLESDRPHVAQELLSAAAQLAETIGGHVVAIADSTEANAARLGSWGADEVIALEPIALDPIARGPLAGDGQTDPVAGAPRSAEGASTAVFAERTHQGAPATEGRADVPATEGRADAPATEGQADAPATGGRADEDGPAPGAGPDGGGPRFATPLAAEDVARGLAAWAEEARPWAILASSTAWGREVAGRAAARLGAGLTGDAVGFDVDGDGRLVAWKPAFGGQVVAAITATSPVQMATVRPGMLPRLEARPDGAVLTRLAVTPRGRVRIRAAARDDDTNTLAEAAIVVGVGGGLTPDDYEALDPLLDVLGAELGCTRKVTDRGWQPHARQIGITGRSIAPNLYVAIALSGKFNHMVGVRSSGTILAINAERDVPVFAAADVGLIGDWREIVPALAAELRSRL